MLICMICLMYLTQHASIYLHNITILTQHADLTLNSYEHANVCLLISAPVVGLIPTVVRGGPTHFKD